MSIEDLVAEVEVIRPTKVEIQRRIEDADYAEHLYNSYLIKVNQVNANQTLIENLVLNTSFCNVDFAGIRFNNRIESVKIGEGLNVKVFAEYQENNLCYSEDHSVFYYIDLYDPNNYPIVMQGKFDENRFVRALLYIMQLDVDFIYRQKTVQENCLDELIDIIGDYGYRQFFESILIQYR